MTYMWKAEYATGNTEIDEQHKQLFKAVNDLISACSSGQGHDVLDPTIKFLVDYTVKHFADEEKLQQQYQYPDFTNHKKLHENFKTTVLKLTKELQEGGTSTVLVGKVNSTIGNWLVNHIQREDKKVADHILSKGGKQNIQQKSLYIK